MMAKLYLTSRCGLEVGRFLLTYCKRLGPVSSLSKAAPRQSGEFTQHSNMSRDGQVDVRTASDGFRVEPVGYIKLQGQHRNRRILISIIFPLPF